LAAPRRIRVASGKRLASEPLSRAPRGGAGTARRAAACRKRKPDSSVRAPCPHVLSEELFKSSLIRQRQRVDRADERLVLMLVAPDEPPAAGCSPGWSAIVDAIAEATRESDVVGWFARDAVIGVMLTDFDVFDAARGRELADRLRRALRSRLDVEAATRFSVRFHSHPGPSPTGNQDLLPAEPLLRQIRRGPIRARIYGAIKRGLDITGSLLLLTALAPLFVLIAAAVKLTSPGPVFFRQKRVGQLMMPFTMFKFRTMSVKADHAVHHEFVRQFIAAGPQATAAGTGGVFKITNDPRVTRVGRVLRKTSLDELPQLLNVLRGDMSLVGPRPPIPYEVEQYKTWHCRRVLEAKPGITGLWQVTGRSRTTFDDMVRLDIRYARTCSLSNDLKILLATPGAVIAGKGAY